MKSKVVEDGGSEFRLRALFVGSFVWDYHAPIAVGTAVLLRWMGGPEYGFVGTDNETASPAGAATGFGSALASSSRATHMEDRLGISHC